MITSPFRVLLCLPLFAVPQTAPAQEKAEPAEAPKPIDGAWAVGTELIGLRSRSNGNTRLVTGSVVENGGKRLVIRLQDVHLWDYVFEHRGKHDFALVDQVGRDPQAGSRSGCSGRLTLRDGCLAGSYAWDPAAKDRVQGKLELCAVGADGGSKNPVVVRWSPGTVVDGSRDDAQLTGRIVRHDGRILAIAIDELFTVADGTRRTPDFVYEFERIASRSGGIRYRLKAQEPLDKGPAPGHRFDFGGEVEVRDDTMFGRIHFKNFRNKPRSHDNAFELRVSGVAR